VPIWRRKAQRGDARAGGADGAEGVMLGQAVPRVAAARRARSNGADLAAEGVARGVRDRTVPMGGPGEVGAMPRDRSSIWRGGGGAHVTESLRPCGYRRACTQISAFPP
jgi:hypothetical protein